MMRVDNRPVTLAQVLQAREDRVTRQRAMLRVHQCSLISFTMNIAGPVKVTPLIRRGFREGLEALERKLPENAVRQREIAVDITGCRGLYAVDMAPEKLKEICLAIEDGSPLGRLFDMDVLTPAGEKLERSTQRGCIVCGAPGRGCAAGRLHTVDQLQQATNRILWTAFVEADRQRIARLCVQSLELEVQTTPKPGLVDRRNSGSHRDMDLHTFEVSARALEPYFSQCVSIGQEMADQTPEATFFRLRQAGLAAEQIMYRVTDGVNTHKGAIFTLGILCGCIGRLWKPEEPLGEQIQLLTQCARMGQAALRQDFPDGLGKGGSLGARGEAAAGLPSVTNISLPVYRAGRKLGLSVNDSAAAALVHLIAFVEDTNLFRRGGREGAAYAIEAARSLLRENPYPKRGVLEELDDAFIVRNLSPGGCADLLAVTLFLAELYPDA